MLLNLSLYIYLYWYIESIYCWPW